MATCDQKPDEPRNHAWLLGAFVERLLRCDPSSVLDVGCGAGGLLSLCSERGVRGIGVDLAGPRLDALAAEGIDVREGSAYSLPCGEGSVDWVTLRHVPHHLEDPARAIAEALRVAGRGLLLAEPYFDPTIPSQRAALALDAWEKRQHRRQGMFHVEPLEFGVLLGVLPEGWEDAFDVEMSVDLRLRDRSVEEFEREAEELVKELDPSDPERGALAEVIAECHRSGLSWNGSACLMLRRREPVRRAAGGRPVRALAPALG